MSELPKGWIETTVGEISNDISYGFTAKSSQVDNGIKYLRITDIQDRRVNWSTVPFCKISDNEIPKYALEVGDIVFARTGATTGKSFLIKSCPKSVFASYLIRLRAIKDVMPEFVAYFFQSHSYWQQISENISGSAQPNCNATKLSTVQILLPPLNEQRRIVEKLEKILGKVEAARERLERVPLILKRFRQSVLAAACSGKLTADWRGKHSSVRSSSFSLQSDSLKAELLTLEELPLRWKISNVGDVIESLKYGTSQKCGYEKVGVPVLRIPNIGEWTIDLTDMKYAELSDREFSQLRLQKGDLLMIRSNGSVSLVGKASIVQDTEKDFAYAGYLIRLRPNKSIVVPEFLNLTLASYDVRLQIEIPARSKSGVNNINSEEVKALKIFLPPIAEQQEIIRRVEELFAFANTIEERYRKAKRCFDKLTQSILAKAFRGELVPQDPRDEPASVLLERIREEKAGAEADTMQKKRLRKPKKKDNQTKEMFA